MFFIHACRIEARHLDLKWRMAGRATSDDTMKSFSIQRQLIILLLLQYQRWAKSSYVDDFKIKIK